MAIMDADKEGFLRSDTSLVQTVGRAARHVNGRVLMYGDIVTESMQRAISETYRRRKLQVKYNDQHGVTPKSIIKGLHDLTERVVADVDKVGVADSADAGSEVVLGFSRVDGMSRKEVARAIKLLEGRMRLAADALEFEQAAQIRDQISNLRQELATSNK